VTRHSEQEASVAVVERICEGTRYQPLRFLGSGAMGQVWVVRQRLLKRDFALKVLHPRFGTSPNVMDRLRLEAQAAGRIDHRGVVRVVDFWVSASGQACYVMELLHGRNLDQELQQRDHLPPQEVVQIGCEALSALGAAHRLGIIHRDIKPENLFLDEVPGYGRVVKILDFGLARVVARATPSTPAPPIQKTRTGARVGTPRFMSPEAAKGQPIDERSDIYSLGLTLFEAAAGRGPFDGPTSGRNLPPSSLVEGIPTALDDCLLTAIAPEPMQRYQSVVEFATALGRLLPRARPWKSGLTRAAATSRGWCKGG
jgi:serine/threonine-protein kinase